MLAFLAPHALGGSPVPSVLEGWGPRGDWALCHRDTARGHMVGVGLPYLFSEPREWLPLEDGWSVALLRGCAFDPIALVRTQQGWADVRPIPDLQGRVWHAPLIRSPGGRRAFRVSYGKNWLPALSPEQARAEEICKAAAEATGAETPMSVACQWAAELLSTTYHLSAEIIATLALLDDALAVNVLRESAALAIEAGIEAA